MYCAGVTVPPAARLLQLTPEAGDVLIVPEATSHAVLPWQVREAPSWPLVAPKLHHTVSIEPPYSLHGAY